MSCSATGRDRSDRTSGNTATASSSSCSTDAHKRRGVSGEDASFGIAGVDVMVDPAGRLYVLEVNASPAAPPPETISSEHAEHLAGFVRDLSRLLVSAGRDCAACGFECLAKE